MLDVDAVFDRKLENVLTFTAHQIPFDLLGIGETFRIFEDELDRNHGRTMFMITVLEMHGMLDSKEAMKYAMMIVKMKQIRLKNEPFGKHSASLGTLQHGKP